MGNVSGFTVVSGPVAFPTPAWTGHSVLALSGAGLQKINYCRQAGKVCWIGVMGSIENVTNNTARGDLSASDVNDVVLTVTVAGQTVPISAALLGSWSRGMAVYLGACGPQRNYNYAGVGWHQGAMAVVRTMFKFNLAGLAGDATGATLAITASVEPPYPGTVSAFVIADDCFQRIRDTRQRHRDDHRAAQ